MSVRFSAFPGFYMTVGRRPLRREMKQAKWKVRGAVFHKVHEPEDSLPASQKEAIWEERTVLCGSFSEIDTIQRRLTGLLGNNKWQGMRKRTLVVYCKVLVRKLTGMCGENRENSNQNSWYAGQNTKLALPEYKSDASWEKRKAGKCKVALSMYLIMLSSTMPWRQKGNGGIAPRFLTSTLEGGE
jgi:hypothetical protein